MNSFTNSSQYKNWIKTKEEIEKIEKSKVSKILTRIKDINNLIKKENEEKSRNNNAMFLDKINSNNSNDDKIVSAINNNEFKKYINPKKLISLEKEKILIMNYSNKLIKILNSQEDKSTSLKNNSISYFRRFYLKKSILDYDPNFLMAASLFLGGKVTRISLSIQDIEKRFPVIKNAEAKFFEYEFFLSVILNYDFYVYNPYQALLGFIYTLQQKEFFLGQSSENYINQNEFKQECNDIIDKMYLTNNIFLFTYSEIALGSIFIKCEQKNINPIHIAEKLEIHKIINVKEFLENKVKTMKENLELIPKYEDIEDEEKKTNEIYKVISHFHKSFPEYQKKLDEERDALRNKLNSFTDDFDDLLKKFNSMPKKK